MARSNQLAALLVVLVVLVYSCNAWECFGGPHDIFRPCGSHCPLTCEQPGPRECIRSCNLNTCQCKKGYFRRNDGQCVKYSDCFKFNGS